MLPSFDGALRPREAELLLQYLTVPYLRVPLLLRFFAQPSHLHALGSAKLQALGSLSGSPSALHSAWDSALDSSASRSATHTVRSAEPPRRCRRCRRCRRVLECMDGA